MDAQKMEHRLAAAWEQLFQYRELLGTVGGPSTSSAAQAEQDALLLFDLLMEHHNTDKVKEQFLQILD